jgi:hypothetical protein
MSKRFTKRNHYNPCFWTAYWNPDYFDTRISRQENVMEPRSQLVYTLNLQSRTIRQTNVNDVFFQKKLGVAEITPDSSKRFCKKYYPNEYDQFCKDVDKNSETLYLDFEDILTEIENMAGYDSLLKAVHIGGLSSPEHKGFLTCVIIIHAMRSYEMMTAMMDFTDFIGMDKWEYFWLLKNAWANPLMLARAVTPLALGKWTFYSTPVHTFPLPDSPVMINLNNFMIVLSPRLLLEIDLTVDDPKNDLGIYGQLSLVKFHEFQLRAISNSFKDIIFHDPAVLEDWRDSLEFHDRAAAMIDYSKSRHLIHAAANRVILAEEGSGRVSPDFEQWAKHYFKVQPNV